MNRDNPRTGAITGSDVKACCVGAYQRDVVGLVLGDSYHPGGLALTRHLGRRLALAPGQRVLDVASGPGTSAVMLARFTSRSASVSRSLRGRTRSCVTPVRIRITLQIAKNLGSNAAELDMFVGPD